MALNNLQRLICHKTKPNNNNKIFLIYIDREKREKETIYVERDGDRKREREKERERKREKERGWNQYIHTRTYKRTYTQNQQCNKFIAITWSDDRIGEKHCQVGWGCRIPQLRLCRGVRHPNECLGYDTKLSKCEFSVMLEICGM